MFLVILQFYKNQEFVKYRGQFYQPRHKNGPSMKTGRWCKLMLVGLVAVADQHIE